MMGMFSFKDRASATFLRYGGDDSFNVFKNNTKLLFAFFASSRKNVL